MIDDQEWNEFLEYVKKEFRMWKPDKTTVELWLKFMRERLDNC